MYPPIPKGSAGPGPLQIHPESALFEDPPVLDGSLSQLHFELDDNYNYNNNSYFNNYDELNWLQLEMEIELDLPAVIAQ